MVFRHWAVVIVLALHSSVAFAERAVFEGQISKAPALTAKDIIVHAHAAAGGATWQKPRSLFMRGYAVFYRGAEATEYDRYEMSRVYPTSKTRAHAADGKVKIEAWRGAQRTFLIAFDGAHTYDANGRLNSEQANDRWSASFGFGAIRHALDAGWTQVRLPDDLVDGRPAYFIELTDPSGAMTRFGIENETYRILYVGFDTDRGWHERHYSAFFTKPGVEWVQPGRVRLFYNGVKQNEVIWTDFSLDAQFGVGHFSPTPEG